jgi:hypothetical protein
MNVAKSMNVVHNIDIVYFNLCIVEEMDSISLCGRERNFIAHADRLSPFTFKEKLLSEDGSSHYLLYAGSLQQPFSPQMLAFHSETGRIYHRITEHKHYTGKYGLLHPHLCLELAEHIVYSEDIQRYVFQSQEAGDDSSYPLKRFDKD